MLGARELARSYIRQGLMSVKQMGYVEDEHPPDEQAVKRLEAVMHELDELGRELDVLSPPALRREILDEAEHHVDVLSRSEIETDRVE